MRHQHEKRGAGRPPVSRLARAAGHPDDPGATPTIAGRSSRRRQRSGAQLVSLVLVRTDGVDVAVVGVGSLAVGVGIGSAYGARCRRDRRRKAQLCVLKDLRAAALAATSAPGPGLTPATSAPGPDSPLPHLHRDWAATLGSPPASPDWDACAGGVAVAPRGLAGLAARRTFVLLVMTSCKLRRSKRSKPFTALTTCPTRSGGSPTLIGPRATYKQCDLGEQFLPCQCTGHWTGLLQPGNVKLVRSPIHRAARYHSRRTVPSLAVLAPFLTHSSSLSPLP